MSRKPELSEHCNRKPAIFKRGNIKKDEKEPKGKETIRH